MQSEYPLSFINCDHSIDSCIILYLSNTILLISYNPQNNKSSPMLDIYNRLHLCLIYIIG